jgi:hypothetical protein
MTYKCNCRVPDPENWTVIKISGRDWIVRCSVCRQVWHTTAAYAADLPRKPISPYQWRKLIHTPDYHKGDDGPEGEPNGYLDPAFESRFTKEEL